MEIAELVHLGYPCGAVRNNYYTAMVAPGVGVCIAGMKDYSFVQFFPWTYEPDLNGHKLYAQFISDKATTTMAENQEFFAKWPHYHVRLDLLLIKCAVEDGLKQIGHMNDAADQSS